MAKPALSGPRSVMACNIGSNSWPSWGSSRGFFRYRPTIPHISSLRHTVSEKFGIALDFPVAHMAAVLHPLHALELDELTHDLRAQHLGEQRVGFQRVAGFLEGLGQGLDAALGDLLQAQAVEVFIADVVDFQLAIDTVQARRDDRGADQVRVAAG